MYTYTIERPYYQKVLTGLISMAAILLSVSSCSSEPVRQYDGYVLDWADDFNGRALDKTIWRHAVGGGGYGNNELQFYTNAPENSRVENGILIIEARREKKAGYPYTSAKLQTLQRKVIQYGRVEVKAKLPVGVGSWPAIWMLPEDGSAYGVGWPDSGEIDIMEHVGYEQGKVHFTVHTSSFNHKAGTHKTGTVQLDDAAEEFHVYGMEWTPDQIRCYVDDQTTFVYDNPGTGWQAWPFDKPFYLILNIACGGDWGGLRGIDNDSFPWRMEVDWVRVYRRAE
ncbi:MAG: glycoside hydrolase family 16 protein [Spirochaetes bacterium]|nr:glycoside hydrolase family 16 protein [Spirochaetota bacterium]